MAALVALTYVGCLEATTSHRYAALGSLILVVTLRIIFAMSAYRRATLIMDWPSVAAFLAALEGRKPIDMARHDEVHHRVTATYASELAVSMDGPTKERIARRLAIDVLATLIKEQYQ